MKYKYNITGVDCPNCASKLATQMAEIDGIDYVRINFLTEKLTVDSSLDESLVYDAVCKAAKAFSKSVKIEK